MKPSVSDILTSFLINRAERALPPRLAEWAIAMRHEMPAVDPKDRVSWAVGCWRASMLQMLRSPDLSVGSIVVALLLLALVAADLLATVLTLAYRLGFLGLATDLGSFTPGDDYRRLIPLMEGLPLWLHGVMVLAAGSYLVAIACTLYRSRAAFISVLSALALELLAEDLGRPIIEKIGVAANPNPGLLARILPVLLPLVIAAVLWNRDARRRANGPAAV